MPKIITDSSYKDVKANDEVISVDDVDEILDDGEYDFQEDIKIQPINLKVTDNPYWDADAAKRLIDKGRIRSFITEDEVLYSLNDLERCVKEFEIFLDTLDIFGIELIETNESILTTGKYKEIKKDETPVTATGKEKLERVSLKRVK